MRNRSIGLTLKNESLVDLAQPEWPVPGESWEHHCDFSECSYFTSEINIVCWWSEEQIWQQLPSGMFCFHKAQLWKNWNWWPAKPCPIISAIFFFLLQTLLQGSGFRGPVIVHYHISKKMHRCTVLAIKNKTLGYDFTSNWISLIDHYSHTDLSYSCSIYSSISLPLPFSHPVPCLTMFIKYVPEKNSTSLSWQKTIHSLL